MNSIIIVNFLRDYNMPSKQEPFDLQKQYEDCYDKCNWILKWHRFREDPEETVYEKATPGQYAKYYKFYYDCMNNCTDFKLWIFKREEELKKKIKK